MTAQGGENREQHLTDHTQARRTSALQDRIPVWIKTGPRGQLPIYATPGSAGCDLIAAEPLVLRPGESRVLPLDLTMALEPGIEAQIRPRSGMSLRTSLRLANAPGTVDSDYRLPVGVVVENTFSQADLPLLLLRRPELAAELARPGRRTTLGELLDRQESVQNEKTANSTQVPGNGQDQAAGNTFDSPADTAGLYDLLPDLAGRTIYLDEHGNPWGTLYFQQGDRIAQMVFARYVQAEFIPHNDPSSIGQDRGGGFGSTGLSSIGKP